MSNLPHAHCAKIKSKMASASLKSSIKMGAEIRLTTYLEETITGEVEAYDAQNDLVVISILLIRPINRIENIFLDARA